MYSWEIQKYLEDKNYHTTVADVYDNLVNTSPQIRLIKMGESKEREFSYIIETYDGYSWIVWMNKFGY